MRVTKEQSPLTEMGTYTVSVIQVTTSNKGQQTNWGAQVSDVQKAGTQPKFRTINGSKKLSEV